MGMGKGGGTTGGVPSSGGGGGRGRATGGGEQRETWITWFEAKLELAKAITPKEGEKTEKVSETERIRRAFGMSEWDPRPTLLYFHYPHDEEDLDKKDAHGKATLSQCKKLDDEKIARWSNLYHCVEVDMSSSETKLLERFGASEGPSFAIVNRDLEVIATSKPCGKKQFVSLLKSTLPKFKEYWKEVQTRLAEQKQAVKEAKALEKKKELERALTRYQEVRGSDLRIGKWYDDAVKDAQRLERKIADGG